MTATFFLRSCCQSRPDTLIRHTGADNAGGAVEACREATPIETIPDAETAWHEAGHVIVGLLHGMVPIEVTAAAWGLVRWEGCAPDTDAQIDMALAGDFAAGLFHRVEFRPYDLDLVPWIDMIRAPAGGGCDRCLILRALVARHGITAPDAMVLSDYRAAEVRTLEILRRRDVRAAIRAVADALMKTGRLTGGEVVTIAGQYIVPGELLAHKGDDE